MGYAMAERLAAAGTDLLVWNRTRAKAEPLAAKGARVAADLAEIAGRDIVFCMVSTWEDVRAVVDRLLGAARLRTRLLVECSSISLEGSAELRRMLEARAIGYLAAPVSGNAKVVKAGRLSFVCSGPRAVFDEVRPLLDRMGCGASWVGEGELARIVKICHNVFLGVITQSLAEVTVLAQKAGVPRHAFLDFLNRSVLGSTFTRYKTPAFVNLDFHVTFTPALLRKDLDLGLEAARTFEAPMPLASLTRDLVQAMMGQGWQDQDFATLLLAQARSAGLALQPENVEVDDGLSA